MTAALVVLGLVVAAQWVVVGLLLRHILRVGDRQIAERDTWARERWELATRIQSPAVAPLLPPPSPTGLGPAEPLPIAAEPDPDEVDESDLVGTIQ